MSARQSAPTTGNVWGSTSHPYGNDLFCACGSALTFSDLKADCAGCHASYDIGQFGNNESTIVSTKFAAAAREIVYKRNQDDGKGAIVDGEVCERCGNDKAYFKTAQLRSVDEGQTVFLECTQCAYRRSENT
jgi:DNA-directed RNA polymerase I subunit RPA12